MRILFTGSGGPIGKRLLESFSIDKNFIIASYRNIKPEIPEALKKNVEILKLDLAKDDLKKLGPVDIIIHVASQTHLTPNSTVYDYTHSNILAMLNLADYAKAFPPKVFIYLSTIFVYGDVMSKELDEEVPFNKPGTYGLSKIMCEHILEENKRYFPSVSIRLPGIVGKGYFTPWLGRVVYQASKNEIIKVYNPESIFNNIVDLIELHRFISWVIENGCNGFEYINLAGSDPIRIREVIDMIISLTDSKSEVIEEKIAKQSFYIKTDKVKTVFKFNPESTKNMIQRYVIENISCLRGLKEVNIGERG